MDDTEFEPNYEEVDVDTVSGYVNSDAVNNESGAKTGAVAATDSRLSAIIAAWSSLTEADQDALLVQAVENSTGQSQTNRS